MAKISSRLVFYFPGFDPLDAAAHQRRYERSAAQSGKTFAIDYEVGGVVPTDAGARMNVVGKHDGHDTHSTIFIHDHNSLISHLRSVSVWKQIALGFKAAGGIIAEGGAWAYMRHAWRFGLFFLFPFLLIAVGLAVAALIAALPLLFDLSPFLCLLSIPLAYLFFTKGLMPFSDRFHTLHLFADWRFALVVGRDEALARDWIEEKAGAVIAALEQSSEEVLFVSHSMGASLALAVAGRVLELKPDAFDGRNVSFVTLGGAALQCGLLSSASRLRQSIGVLARNSHVNWFDIQCLTDPIHLYKCNTADLTGHADADQPKIVTIRFKHSLSDERYQKNKRNFLRMHRQYVLGSDRKSGFDFTLLTAGPLPAASFAELRSDVPPQMFR
jgi:pimeloyl-ACP methyl ester carboxylesterase